MAFSSHIVTINRLKTLIDGFIGKKSNLPNNSKTITENIADLVFGVKGSAESTYRKGNINITPANLGLGNVNNTADLEKTVYNSTHVNGTQMSFSNISNMQFSQSLSGSQVTTSIEFDSDNIGRILFQIRSTGEIGMYIWDPTANNWHNYWTK